MAMLTQNQRLHAHLCLIGRPSLWTSVAVAR
jgi:hypothetical protein